MEVSGTKKYYPELDIVKGIAILLVILGHSFCSFPFDLNAQLPPVLGKIVRSFQMPLFFIHHIFCNFLTGNPVSEVK